MPTLSVVLCAYNEAATLPRSLAAIQGQSRPADELIFLNDGSTDATGRIMAAAIRPPGWCLTTTAPSGPPAAYNFAVSKATGDWLYLASANDQVQPGAFAAWAAAVKRWPEAVIVVGETDEAPLGWAQRPRWLAWMTVKRRLQLGEQMHGAAVFIRRDAWQRHGGHRPDLAWLGDWWLNHTLALSYGAIFVPQQIARLSRSPSQYSYGFQDAAKMARVAAALVAQVRASPPYVQRAFWQTPLYDFPHVGSGLVRHLLAEVA